MFAFAILILGMAFISAEDNTTDQAPTTTTNQTITISPTNPDNQTSTITPSNVTPITISPISTTPVTGAPISTKPATTTEGIIKEQIKCVFKNAVTPQKCYTAGDNSRFYCTGEGTCVIDVNGNREEKITWKSTCGGYAYTIVDGNNEYAEFNCLPEGNTTMVEISGKGFRYAYWECYNGEEQTQGSIKPSCDISEKDCYAGKDLAPGTEPFCKSSETWQNYAKEFCKDKCYADGSKCGANSFSVAGECYLEAGEESSIPAVSEEESTIPPISEKEKQYPSGVITEKTLICKDSCPLEGKCYPFGYRKSNNFCSDIGSFVEQVKADSTCENNFECSSNVCVSGTCISEGIIQKFLNWFKNLFG